MRTVNIASAPIAVQTAFAHVRALFPDVTSVSYDEELHWLFETAAGDAPSFDGAVDVGLLEDAADALDEFPVKFTL